MRVLIIGAGIGGLTAALSLHAAGIDCSVVDSAPELRPLGVGINLQPHAVRELVDLGLGEALEATGIQTSAQVYANRFGNVILTLPRGRGAGYLWPQYSIHRGRLQMILLDAVRARLGPGAVRLGLAFQDFARDPEEEGGKAGTVTALLRDVRTGEVVAETADVLAGADGVHSAVRARLHPGHDELRWSGIRMWRGVTERDPYLDGATLLVAGSNAAAKFVAYPICAEARARGRASMNWVAEVRMAEAGAAGQADWHREGALEDVLPHFADWFLPDLDVPKLITGADRILEYPMVDKDPLPRWNVGRATLLGDAAHPMYPIGSNGGSQAILDARFLALTLARNVDPAEGLAEYERERRPATTDIVLACRRLPMDETIELVERRAPDGFADISEVLSARELAEMAAAQKTISDMDVTMLNQRPSWNVAR
ncbi:2-polyprenyl-6-methoxyphenol hydroxylase-like FAD-dependent oxidoreductase [Thermocatellispora tengchongensis]|uniref:2-polyprenyl-6-methoxyphenol hydroxylase-like FAD-dependent oxidoreductase n=1 Tax=Thermocatellispora tengchongensis TaxID=1073253 RepID=A0A840PMI8_9ACTN|nr:flavin-dependent oxidoreductase [Thermocatellispora tengchongensis]MBB5138257.1 2-polyprenyl-6-methoxyphenol hydroxylase-like FAD-dependent oxidoreductase [Thermocatellispora tengchongensis]